MSRDEFAQIVWGRTVTEPYRVRHKSGRIYVVLGLALEGGSSEERWVVVYHHEDSPGVLFYQSPWRFCEMSEVRGKPVPRFELVDDTTPDPSKEA